MQVLSRRLYNGGFNHLKSTSHLLRKAPRVVGHPALTRSCSVAAAKLSGDIDTKSPALADDPTAPSPSERLHDTHMSAYKDFTKANERYVASFGEKGKLPLPPAKKLLIITCMDARINVYAELGIQEGEAHIVRNAGGDAKEALRSIIISQRLLGTREIAVFHHTGCGMVTFNTPQLRKLVKDSDPSNPALNAVDEIDFHEFNGLEESVKADVKFLQENPLVLPGTKITGWVYEVETGKIRQIV
ncbi:carbonic anhydrase [Polyporus arcularius HHB13444]|uniref:Carbonic anhydrase n=1 Tax=Polyporus arcularius HHB13444 TaxID=1314778 RepID=A0A5C3Q4Z5_9APHY|nr:carbonic anhydrase [Polyporus arcularius HHB13444]